MDIALALVDDGRHNFLFLKRRKGKEDGILWAFPGGKIEARETDRAAVVRETFEETGLIVDAVKRLGSYRISPDLNLIHWHCISTGGLLRHSCREVTNVGFYSVPDMERLFQPRSFNPVMRAHIEMVCNLRSIERPVGAIRDVSYPS